MKKRKNTALFHRWLAFLLVLSFCLSCAGTLPLPVFAADPDATFSNGAVLIDASYNGKNILIKNGVFSVTVSGATGVTILFESVTMDRRYDSDTSGTVPSLYSVAQSLGWRSGNTYYAQTCPLLVTNNASVTVAFRGENNFYAGTNRCTVSSTNRYTKNQSGGGFAGIQVDAGSSLTIAESGGTINAYGAFYVEGDNSENADYRYNAPAGTTHNSLSGGAGIGGGVAWNTTTSNSSSYTAGTPGTITINGGNVNAFGGHQAAGIGGGLNSAATTSAITINGGNVCAYGGRWAAGIGDGDSLLENWPASCANTYGIIINGGNVSAVGGVACPGIGTTDELTSYARNTTSGMEIHLNGGTITARAGYPSLFDPEGNDGYTGTDAAAAIGAGNMTNMASNSISVSSGARVIASGFGHYAITENGTHHDEAPKINIDSSGYMFLGRFPVLASSESRIFELFEAQRYNMEIDGKRYEYIKYVTQPADGSAGEIYYYCAEAPDHRWLLRAGADGSIENAAVVPLGSTEALKAKMEELLLTLWVDDASPKIDTVNAPAFFRSIALSLPNPEEHGGIYALRIPTAATYGYKNESVALPKSGYATITIDAREQGTISGELAYPSAFNIALDSVSDTLTDLDIYRDGQYSDGRDGLIGSTFMENVFAYRVYLEPGDNTAYLFAKYVEQEGVRTTFTSLDGLSLSKTAVESDWVVVAKIDMTGVTERTIRLKKADTVTIDGMDYTPSAVVYKITIIKKAVYRVELDKLDKTYDGTPVKPNLLRLYTEESGAEYTPTAAELSAAEYTFSRAQGTAWGDTLDSAPKNAGVYRVTVRIATATYIAEGELAFAIEKRPLSVSRIQNPLVYVSSAEHVLWAAPHPIPKPGVIYLLGIVGTDEVTASAESVFFNDVTIGYDTDKITLSGITLSGADAENYETEDTQTVFGQISYSLDGAIFRKKAGSPWHKFYPVDSKEPVDDKTADYHSPANNGVYDTHGEYLYARTENMGDEQAIYAVDIEYGAMYFSYSRSQWNADDMVYEELEGESRWSGFDGENNRIVIINRSNFEVCYAAHSKIDFIHSSIGDSTVGIRADFYGENASSGTKITGTTQVVPAATAGTADRLGTAGKAFCYLILSGVPQLGDSEHFTVVGTVSVTVFRLNR